MPIYEYVCASCEHTFAHLARTLTDKPAACPACGKKRLNKQFSSFAASVAKPTGCGSCASEASCPAVRSGGCGCAGACSH